MLKEMDEITEWLQREDCRFLVTSPVASWSHTSKSSQRCVVF